MEGQSTKTRRGLSFSQALIFCGVVIVLYKIFRSPALEKQIADVAAKVD